MIKFSPLFCALALSALFQSAQAAPNLLQQFPVKAAPTQKRGPTQSQVARKTAFPSVSKSALKGALDARNLALATKNAGKNALFTGTVLRVFAPKSGSIVLLNFAENYKSALVGSIRDRDFRRFPDLQTLKGKRVALRGKVVLYKGAPQIELTQNGAIRLVR